MKFGTLISSETKPLTREVVSQHLALTPAPVEREFNQKRYDYLKEKVDLDLFVVPHWVVGVLDGESYRMNGQHSGRVLADLDGHLPEGLHVHIDTYKVDTMGGFAWLFRQFDARQSSRTSLDVSGAYQGLIPELSGVPIRAAQGLVNGYCFYQGSVLGGPVPRSGDGRYEKMSDPNAKSFILWAQKLWTSKAREVQRPGIIAAMYGTFEKEETDADRFWDDVVRDVNPDELAAASKLAAELQRAFKNHTVKFKPLEYYVKCIKAWNAFRRGVAVRDLRVDLKKAVPEIE